MEDSNTQERDLRIKDEKKIKSMFVEEQFWNETDLIIISGDS